MRVAGIGFELRKIFKDKSIHGKMKGIIYASMSTIGPTILFILLLFGIRIVMDTLKVPQAEQIFFSSACLYLFVIASIISGSLNTISSRFISDKLFEEKEEYIPATLFGVVFIGSVLSAGVGLLFCLLLYYQHDISISFLLGYYLFGIMITLNYCIITFVSAIKEYAKITVSFFIGVIISVLMFCFLYYVFNIPAIVSIIYSLATGFIIINIRLIYYIISYFDQSNHQYFEFVSYFKRYPKLFFSGLFYVIGLYAANIIYWFFSEISVSITIFRVAPAYDMATFLALLINLPAIVIFTVKVETHFYEKYKDYVFAIGRANYASIEKARKNMENTIDINLFYIYEVQLIITVILTCISVVVFPMLGFGGLTLDFFLLLGIAYYSIFSMYFTIIFLYYFMDQQGSFVATSIFLSVTIIIAVIALKIGSGYYAAAPFLGAFTAWLYAFFRLKYILKDINAKIYCGELN